MNGRINGASSSRHSVPSNSEQYVCYTAAPMSFTNPDPNPAVSEHRVRLVNIQITGNIAEQSQKNFEILIMAIGLRSMPIIMSNPIAVNDLTDYPDSFLSGNGFMWEFAAERGSVFHNYGPNGTIGPTGFLVDELDGIILASGVRLTTKDNSSSGWTKNITFSYKGNI